MSMLGTRVLRTEDPKLLMVGGRYVDDLAFDDVLHAVFVRSTVAHAELGSIGIDDAVAAPGVAGVFTAAGLGLAPLPPALEVLNQDMKRTWLASDRLRYVGEPHTVVVAETLSAATDAAEQVRADVEVRPAVVTTADARTGDTLLYPEAGTNIAFQEPSQTGDDFFDECEVTVSLSFPNPRLAPCPLEPRSTVAVWAQLPDGRDHLTLWTSTQNAHGSRDALVAALGLTADQVRVVCPDVGGGFGAKNGYPEDIVVAMVARQLGRPVKWTETRTESMLGLVHGRACSYDATIGGTSDGRITAYRVHLSQDSGAHPTIGAYLPSIGKLVASGAYDIAKVDYSSTSYVTNTVAIGAYRGAGRPEAALAIERMIDAFAAELGIDPIEIRRRNFIAPETFPVTTPTGAVMDVGEYEPALQAVIDASGYAALREEQGRRRLDPTAPLLGLGWSTYVAIANAAETPEFGSIELGRDGSAVVRTGSSDHGQGHFTAFAQIASDVTGIPFAQIEVRRGDTDEVPRGGGTSSSKSLQIGGSAVVEASTAMVEKAREVAGHLLEANPSDVVLDTTAGTFSVRGTPAVSVGWPEVAAGAAAAHTPLHEEVDFVPGGRTFPFGAHLSVVEVDRDTGKVTVLRHFACDDAGTIVNPMLFAGQVHGGTTAGLAQALVEEFRYDNDGNPLTANLMDYSLISASELPFFDVIPQETPRLRNPLGVSGIGEAGASGATPAVQNAVVDALSHLGVRHVDIPVTPERVWRAMAGASPTQRET